MVYLAKGSFSKVYPGIQPAPRHLTIVSYDTQIAANIYANSMTSAAQDHELFLAVYVAYKHHSGQ